MTRSTIIYGSSIALHVALGVTVAAIRHKERGEVIAISMAESKKKAPDPPKPVEPAQVKEADTKASQPKPAARAKSAPAEAKPASEPKPQTSQAQAAAALDALPDFGISLSGGTGGPGGFAVPAGGGGGPQPVSNDPPPKAAAPKALAPKPTGDCTEAVVKPKPKGVASPAYTSAAREANIEGKVRVEVSVAADGSVTNARVISGLGYGLDEAALAAARRATFEPATRCGKPVAATFVIAMRFSL